jgi:hypothetical protein
MYFTEIFKSKTMSYQYHYKIITISQQISKVITYWYSYDSLNDNVIILWHYGK